jgi:hypothetical protein
MSQNQQAELHSKVKHTTRQEEAYRHLYIIGNSMEEAGKAMDIQPRCVRNLLSKFFKHYPELKMPRLPLSKMRTVGDLSKLDETKIVRKW